MSKKRNPIFLLVSEKVLYGSLTRPHYGAYQLLIAYMSQSLLYHPISFAWICMATMRPSDPKHILPTTGGEKTGDHFITTVESVKHHSKKQILVITGVPIPQSLNYIIPLASTWEIFCWVLAYPPNPAEPFGLHKSKFI